METWKKVPNFSKYMAEKSGLIKTFNWKGSGQERIMKPAVTNGYAKTVMINDQGEYKSIKVHRIIALTFCENPFNKDSVNHINGIKTDNRAENLEWCTHQENIKHAVDNNLMVVIKGEQIGNSKLKEHQVLEIRAKFIPRKYTRVKLAKEYNVTEGTIKDILYKRTWNHI